MLTSDIISAIERTANPCWQAAWDKSGVQIAAMRREVSRMAVLLDPVPSALRQALDAGAQFILSHHPLALKPALPSRLNAWHESLRLLLGADVPLYAAHTSLDVNLAGPAGWPGRALELINKKPLEPIDGQTGAIGYGEVGDLPNAMATAEFLQLMLKLVKLPEALLCGPQSNGTIRRVAYCGGSGSSLLTEAADSGADIYITGDIKHHAALESELPVLDIGHHSLEEEMMRQFAALLGEELPEIEVFFLPSVSPFRVVRKQ